MVEGNFPPEVGRKPTSLAKKILKDAGLDDLRVNPLTNTDYRDGNGSQIYAGSLPPTEMMPEYQVQLYLHPDRRQTSILALFTPTDPRLEVLIGIPEAKIGLNDTLPIVRVRYGEDCEARFDPYHDDLQFIAEKPNPETFKRVIGQLHRESDILGRGEWEEARRIGVGNFLRRILNGNWQQSMLLTSAADLSGPATAPRVTIRPARPTPSATVSSPSIAENPVAHPPESSSTRSAGVTIHPDREIPKPPIQRRRR